MPNVHKIYQHLQLQDPPKFTQIGIFWFENVPSGRPVPFQVLAEQHVLGMLVSSILWTDFYFLLKNASFKKSLKRNLRTA
jgi:hypothetical protein